MEHLIDAIALNKAGKDAKLKIDTTGQPKPFNWRTLERVRQDNADFEALLGWLNRSLTDKRAYTYEQYASMVGQELIKNDA